MSGGPHGFRQDVLNSVYCTLVLGFLWPRPNCFLVSGRDDFSGLADDSGLHRFPRASLHSNLGTFRCLTFGRETASWESERLGTRG